MNKPLKIALISPKGPLYRHNGGIFRKSLRIAPLTLTTLSSLIPEEIPAQIQIIDEGVENIPRAIDADLVAMTAITGSALRAYELAKIYRSEGKTVILGGPHVTLLPEEAQNHADSIVVGYAERTWPQLIRDFYHGALKPRYDMDADFSLSEENPPFPHRFHMRKKAYRIKHSFEASRGCIHSCEFCVVPTAWGRKPFLKNIDYVIEDIKQSGGRHLIFYDLNLIANVNYAKALFTALIPLKVKWFGMATTLLTHDMISLMAKSGCKGLLIGFESLSEASLSDANKRFNRPQTYHQLIRCLKDHKILINGTFVFGNDSDTVDSLKQVKEFILEQKIDLPRFSILTPFPNTGLYKRLERENRILTKDGSLYDGQHVVFQPRNMSPAELVFHHEKIWRDIYSTKNICTRIAKQMITNTFLFPVVLGANAAYRFYANQLGQFYTQLKEAHEADACSPVCR